MELKGAVSKGFAWQMVNFGFKAVLNLVFLAIITRLLEKEDFGVYAIITILSVFINNFTEVGVGAALIHLQDFSDRLVTTAFTSAMFIGCFISVITIFLAPFISIFFEQKISPYTIQIVALNSIILSISAVTYSKLASKFEFDKIAYASIISFVVGNLIVALTLGYYGFGIWALIFGIIIKSIIYSSILFYYSPHTLKLRIYPDELKKIYKYGLQLTFLRLVNSLSKQIDKLILGKLLPIETLGYYERSLSLLDLPIGYVGSISDSVLFSLYAKMKSSKVILKKVFIISISILSYLMIFIGIHLKYNAKSIVNLLYGRSWEMVADILNILGWIVFFSIYSRIIDTLVRATGELKKSVKIKILNFIIQFFAISLGFYLGGFVLCLYFLLISNIIYSILMVILLKSIVQLSFVEFVISQLRPFLFFILLLFEWYILCDLLFIRGNKLLLISLLVHVFTVISLLFLYPTFFGRKNVIYIMKFINSLSKNQLVIRVSQQILSKFKE